MIFDPAKLAKRQIELGDDWADKNAAADHLEEGKKSILAEIMLKFPGESNASAKTKAEASEKYKGYILAMVDARKEANKAKVRYDTSKAYNDNMRTLESTKRAEMQLR